MTNGVGISDPCWWYTNDEIPHLSCNIGTYILNCPNSSSIASTNNNNCNNNVNINDHDSLCNAFIKGVMNTQNNVEIYANKEPKIAK